MRDRPWHLVADIGGTNARFAVVDQTAASMSVIRHYSVTEFPAFDQALNQFLEDVGVSGEWRAYPQNACLAVAAPVGKEVIRFTNSDWVVEHKRLCARLQLDAVDVINDFAAVGFGIASLNAEDWHQVGGGVALPGKPIAVLGPGTGLGVCLVLPAFDSHHVVASEGGHVDFAPTDETEIGVLQILAERFGHVSVERLLSGSGLVNLYQSLAALRGVMVEDFTPADITAAACAGSDGLCADTLALFFRVLGSTAGNLALTAGAQGGIYIGGGIVPQILTFLERSEFRARFEAKGRYAGYMREIPVRILLKPDLGLLGAKNKLGLVEVNSD